MANLTSWARSMQQAHQYLLDGIGHGLESVLGRQCHKLALDTLATAERAAQEGNREEHAACLQLRKTLNALHPTKIGGLPV